MSCGGLARLALVVSGGGDDHQVAGAGQGLVGFGTALEHARCAASGTPGPEVGGAAQEHFLQGPLAGSRMALDRAGVLPVADGIGGAFEAQLSKRRAVLPGALQHAAAD